MFANLIFFCLIAGAFTSSHSGSSSAASSSSSASSATTPSFSEGPCPNVVVAPVNLKKKGGYWFEAQRSANNYDGSDLCAKVLWRKPVKGVSVVINKSYSTVSNGVTTSVLRVIQDRKGTRFTYGTPVLGNVNKEHLVLDIDYKHYSILWTCENQGNGHMETAWVMLRRPALPKNIDHLKQKAFAKYNLTVPEMVTQNFSNCSEHYSSYDFCS
ncbi:apolipoprotein D-like isoform X2 [Cotesia typhae]|uniref:apolipoprotein D-like isoform X2 n=1 Tax=Cotesia typhae TaxID=2053667 RepID=UPI003D68C6BC